MRNTHIWMQLLGFERNDPDRGPERARQPWTNYDIRILSRELKRRGVPLYAGIMGVYTHDKHHHEWLSEHPELRCQRRDCVRSLMCLKRFKDGTLDRKAEPERDIDPLCEELPFAKMSEDFIAALADILGTEN